MAKNGNIVKYRKPFTLNIGLIILLILFGYIVFSSYSYINKDKISFYEVTDGGMAKNTEHLGIAIRNELSQYSDRSGYLNPLASNGSRVSVGDEVFAVDHSGILNNYLSSDSLSNIKLNEEDINSVKIQLSEFSQNYRDCEFSNIYDVKAGLFANMMDFASSIANDSISANGTGAEYKKFYTPSSGVISFSIDGFEDRSVESINIDDFNRKSISANVNRSGARVESGDVVCKIVTSESWDLIFPLSKDEEKLFSNINNLLIKFKKNGIRITVPFTQVSSADGHMYGRCTLQKYMVDFINDRYIPFDIDDDSIGGLKIPKSAVVEKTFLTVPEAYLTHGGDDFSSGFYKEIIGPDGNTIQYIPTEVFNQLDDKLYIDFSSNAELQPGDTLVKPGSNERYKLGETENLSGVYNINKGYAIFKQIEVIDSNDEYYTVKKNQKYGLVVYDHILFNPDGINEGDFIYQ